MADSTAGAEGPSGRATSPALAGTGHLATDLVGFELVVSHRYGNASAKARYLELLHEFEAQHGRIRLEYWGDALPGAAALTDKPELCICYANLDVEHFDSVARVIDKVLAADFDADRLLAGRNLVACKERLFQVGSEAVDFLNEGALRKRKGTELSASWVTGTLGRLKDGLAIAEVALDAAANRRGQFYYFGGMLAGLAAATVLAGVAAIGQAIGWIEAPIILSGTVFGGALGSVVSVLSRMTRGSLKLDYQAGMDMLLLLGAVRPFVGAALATAIILLVVGGLIPLTVPAAGAAHDASLLGLSFLAGFSERWAQDMLSLGRKGNDNVR